MSVFNCHVNRAPVSGVLTDYVYTPGKKLAAFAEKASFENEQNLVTLSAPAAPASRSSRSPARSRGGSSSISRPATPSLRGQRVGIILFGSRVDLFVPDDAEILVVKGQKVKASLTRAGALERRRSVRTRRRPPPRAAGPDVLAIHERRTRALRRVRLRRLSRERLSRGLFVLPTLFTVGNLFCGYLSLWCSINGTFERAALLIIVAAVLDMLDGRIARLTNSASEFGEEYDSLADLVSFGVAPAILVYSWGLADFHRLGLAVSFFFVVCGSMRLARFNIQTHIADKKYFVGLPIPAAAGTICTLVLATPDPLVDRVWMTGALVVDVRPVVPDDLDDPLPVVQGPRPEAAPAGMDPPGDRALLHGDRVPADRHSARPRRRLRELRARSRRSSGSFGARGRLTSLDSGRGRRTTAPSSSPSRATSAPADDRTWMRWTQQSFFGGLRTTDPGGLDLFPRAHERLEEPQARRAARA